MIKFNLNKIDYSTVCDLYTSLLEYYEKLCDLCIDDRVINDIIYNDLLGSKNKESEVIVENMVNDSKWSLSIEDKLYLLEDGCIVPYVHIRLLNPEIIDIKSPVENITFSDYSLIEIRQGLARLEKILTRLEEKTPSVELSLNYGIEPYIVFDEEEVRDTKYTGEAHIQLLDESRWIVYSENGRLTIRKP